MAKKKKNQDFQKVKIKAGKKLPKHLNETRPEFKAKKIHVKPFTFIAQNSKELVKLLTNIGISTSTKLTYLAKLNEMLLSEVEDGSNQAGEQIQVVCKFLRDPNEKCRSMAINCLKSCIRIISTNGEEVIEPVLNILFTHLNSGFTVLDTSIQKDCKQFFEYLLQRADNSLNNQLMKIFISKIEKFPGTQIMDYETYNLLNMFIEKRTEYFADKSKESDENKLNSKENAITLEFSTDLQTIPLHNPLKLAKRYSNLQNFRLDDIRFGAAMNLKDRFLEPAKKMVMKDAQALMGKKADRELQLAEAQKLNCVLQILRNLRMSPALVDYWRKNQMGKPKMHITRSPSMEKKSKEEKKWIGSQGQLNEIINVIYKQGNR